MCCNPYITFYTSNICKKKYVSITAWDSSADGAINYDKQFIRIYSCSCTVPRAKGRAYTDRVICCGCLSS